MSERERDTFYNGETGMTEYEEARMIVRVTEERLTIEEVSYDVNVPVGTDLAEVEEFLDREKDEVARTITVSHNEITNTEVLDG